jgi:hypothetical protein
MNIFFNINLVIALSILSVGLFVFSIVKLCKFLNNFFKKMAEDAIAKQEEELKKFKDLSDQDKLESIYIKTKEANKNTIDGIAMVILFGWVAFLVYSSR